MQDKKQEIREKIENKKKQLELLNKQESGIKNTLFQSKRDLMELDMQKNMFKFVHVMCEQEKDSIYSVLVRYLQDQNEQRELKFKAMIKKNYLFSERKLDLILIQREKIQQEIKDLEFELKNGLRPKQQEYAKPSDQSARNKNKQSVQSQPQQYQPQQRCGTEPLNKYQNSIEQKYSQQGWCTGSQYPNQHKQTQQGYMNKYQNSIEQKQTQQVCSAIPGNRCTNLIEEKCAVCLINMEEKDVVTVLTCDHCFHQKCISDWFKKSPTCPLCRKQQ